MHSSKTYNLCTYMVTIWNKKILTYYSWRETAQQIIITIYRSYLSVVNIMFKWLVLFTAIILYFSIHVKLWKPLILPSSNFFCLNDYNGDGYLKLIQWPSSFQTLKMAVTMCRSLTARCTYMNNKKNQLSGI